MTSLRKLIAASVITGATALTMAGMADAQGTTAGSVTYSRQAFAEGVFGAYSKSNCAKIVSELRRQGASPAVAYRLGHTIAWRESGCSMQCVSDRDDHSCSRFGINFRFRGASAGWNRLCGAPTREHTKPLKKDAQCALAAYKAMGWRPWR